MGLSQGAIVAGTRAEPESYWQDAARPSIVIPFADGLCHQANIIPSADERMRLRWRREVMERVRVFRTRRQLEAETPSTKTEWRVELREKVRAFRARRLLEGDVH